jgi:hypothetical protein
LNPGGRLWFESGALAGDTVLVAQEALSDMPAFLATRRLMRRFGVQARARRGAREAVPRAGGQSRCRHPLRRRKARRLGVEA